MPMKSGWKGWSAALLLCMAFGCNPNDDNQRTICPPADQYESSDEKKVGERVVQYIFSHPEVFPMLDSSDYDIAYEKLRDSVLRLVAINPEVQRWREFQWQAYILHDDRNATAFMLPGGYLFISTGLLKQLDGYHELMQIVAHELAYADSKIAIERLVENFNPCDLGEILLEKEVTPHIERIASYFLSPSYTDQDVLYADSIAVEILCQYRYKVTGLIELLERSKTAQPPIAWVEDKAADADFRISSMNHLISSSPDCKRGTVTNTSGYLRFKTEYLP